MSFIFNEKIAVHLHIFYTDKWVEIARYLSHLEGLNYDLFVTLVNPDTELESQIKATIPTAKIFITENKGYDVGAFIYFLQQINLSDYDYILKIHTKNDEKGLDTLINHRYLSRKQWCNILWNSVLGSKKQVRRNLQALKNRKTGMIGSKYLITSNLKNHPKVEENIGNIIHKLKLPRPTAITFIPGTMFWIKSEILAIIKENFSLSDFEPTDKTVKDGTLAHALERVFGYITTTQGYQIKGFDHVRNLEAQFSIKPFLRFCYQQKYTHHNKRLIKILKIPVYNRKAA